MFREIRRTRQQLATTECAEMLATCNTGVLAVVGDEGYPYAVPLNYAYEGNAFFFHCAKEGHKLDAIATHACASFCVVAEDDVIPEKLTTRYASVIAFGRIHIVEDEADRRHALGLLASKYGPDDEQTCNGEIEKTLPHVCILRLDIEHMSGKQGLERMRR